MIVPGIAGGAEIKKRLENLTIWPNKLLYMCICIYGGTQYVYHVIKLVFLI
jgi:hypothetical protein